MVLHRCRAPCSRAVPPLIPNHCFFPLPPLLPASCPTLRAAPQIEGHKMNVVYYDLHPQPAFEVADAHKGACAKRLRKTPARALTPLP